METEQATRERITAHPCQAEEFAAKATRARERAAAEEGRLACEREERIREFDQRFVAELHPERLDGGLREMYDAAVAGVWEWPVMQALVAHHAAVVRRQILRRRPVSVSLRSSSVRRLGL